MNAEQSARYNEALRLIMGNSPIGSPDRLEAHATVLRAECFQPRHGPSAGFIMGALAELCAAAARRTP